MNKVLILTLHSQNNNFGSVLQAYSLYTFVEEAGCYPVILNYQPYYSNGFTNLRQGLKKLMANCLFLKDYLLRKTKFNKIFIRERMTKKIKKYDKLEKYANGYDVYLVGSDQVWNPKYLCGKDKAYYFDFLPEARKVSYASSLGTIDLSDKELTGIANSIRGFQKVSLREKKSVLQLRTIGFDKAEYVLDPVFLHNKAFYTQMQVPTLEKNYILAYIIHKDSFMSQVVEKLSQLMNKKVIQIGGFASKCKSEKFFRSAGPMEFLGLIDGADFIITSSFHGTAFAHIYNKQFAVVMPKYNTLRIENILETVGTTDRVISDLTQLENILKPIDYDLVNRKIDIMRKTSEKYLLSCLQSAKEKK